MGTSTLFLVPGPSSVEAHINALAVLPEYRRRGFGRQILSWSVEELLAKGRNRVMIEVQTDNERALDLYLSVGFEKKATYAYYKIDVPEV